MSALDQTRPDTYAASDSDREDGQAIGGRRAPATSGLARLETPTALRKEAGQLLKGAVNEKGELKDAALMIGIKLDLEAEIHLTARVKGDITVGLY